MAGTDDDDGDGDVAAADNGGGVTYRVEVVPRN